MLRLARSLALALALAHTAAARADTDAAPATVRYQLGLLTRGPAWTPEQNAHTDSIQAGHMENILRMAQSGALVAAGPFENGGVLRGVFVWTPEATALDSMLAGDPAIVSGRLECRLAIWVGPAGIGDDYRRRAAQGLRDSMVTYGWVMLRRGPKYDSRPTPAVEQLIRKHFEYTEKLRASGRLIYAGAIEGTGDLRGVLVMQGDSAAAARAMMDDPAVKAGRFTPQVLRWWTALGNIPGH